MRANFSDPLQLNRLNLTRVLQPDDVARRRGAPSPAGGLPALRLARPGDLERRELLRSLRSDENGTERLYRRSRVSPHAGLRRAAADRPRSRRCVRRQSRPAAALPEHRSNVDRLFAYDVTLQGHNLRASLGRVDDEKGRRWSLTLDGNAVRQAPGTAGRTARSTSARRCQLTIRRSGCAARLAGHQGARDDPFANFFFGGFGNNYVDRLEEKRYRQYYAFPGAELQRDRRPQLRENDARMEPASAPVPQRRDSRLLSDVDASGGLRRRPW